MRTARLPSVRAPRTFYDVFGVAVITVAAVTTVWSDAVVGYEVVAALIALALWTAWTVQQILERMVPDDEPLPP